MKYVAESSSSQRRQFLKTLGLAGIGTAAFQRALAAQVEEEGRVTKEMIAQAEWIAGIELDDEQRDEVAEALQQNERSIEQLQALPVDADTVPAIVFRPDFFYAQASESESDDQESGDQQSPVHETPDRSTTQVSWSLKQSPSKLSDSELAFASVTDQASLLAAKKLSSKELTELYLQRLEKYDPLLKCVITMLTEPAIEQAEASDKRRATGRTQGILDGIPWVAKDLVAMPPWKTTWGCEPFKNQVRESVATVAKKLESAGAVCLAKVSLGALAWGDQWFDAKTRNPWNPEQGSSGSSAGSASAIAAGLATFALGTETLGSIVSPTTRCRTSGLRPTFGRVSRAGCMPLAWSMDKVGPIARHADDLALVFAALLGTDGKDPTVVNRPFQWPVASNIGDLKVGVTKDRMNAMEKQSLEFLKSEGATIVDVDLSSEIPVSAMSFILGVEASTVFDDAFRADPDANYGNWPGTFREARFMTAIQYLRANRMRSQLVTETQRKLAKVDFVLGGSDLLLTNLSGHPSIVVACGSDESRSGIKLPGVVKLTAAAYREETLLHVAAALQKALPPSPSQPPLDDWLKKMAEKESTNESSSD